MGQMASLRSYGTRSCFLCGLPPPSAHGIDSDGTPEIWHATQKNSFFMYSKLDFVALGLSDQGYAFHLDADLTTLVSTRTETFDNPPLGELRMARVLGLVWK